MATLVLTPTFSAQTSTGSPAWGPTPGFGTYEVSLSPTFATEEATYRTTYTFPDDVTISSATFSWDGALLASGITSATLYLNFQNRGSVTSSFTFTGNAFASLSGRTLTIELYVQAGPYTGTAPVLRMGNPTVTVTYTVIPSLHNLGINF